MLGFGSFVSNIPIPEVIKKRVINYLLKRYVGQFLEEELSLDQLTVEIISGTGIFKELYLNVEALNETAEQLNLPFKFVDGYIAEICLSIPWKALLSENCFVEVSGLVLTLQPKQRADDVSLVDSMINSMSTSMQIAQECLSQVEAQTGANFENLYSNSPASGTVSPDKTNIALGLGSQDTSGVERFAHAIDTILSRVKIRFVDTVIRLENAPKNSISGVAVEIKINKIDYFDEAGLCLNKDSARGPSHQEKPNTAFSDSFSAKKLLIEGITLYTAEFSSLKSSKCEANSAEHQIHQNSSKFHKDINTSIDLSPLNDDSSVDLTNGSRSTAVNLLQHDTESILCAKLYGCQEFKVRLRQTDSVGGPKIQIEANCGSLMAFFSPRQIHHLMDFVHGFLSPEETNFENGYTVKVSSCESKQKPMSQHDFRKVEHELLRHLTPPVQMPIRELGRNLEEGWSLPPAIYNDDEFLPVNPGSTHCLKTRNTPMSSSRMSDMSELETSFTSTLSGHVYQGRGSVAHTSCKNIKIENEVHMSFKVRINSLGLVVLHEDLLLPSLNQEELLVSSSVADMQAKSKEFFTCVGNIWHSENSYKEFVDLKGKLSKSCSLSHIRVISSPISIDGTEQTISSRWERNTAITIGWCEIIENLYEEGFHKTTTSLLGFSIAEPQGQSQFALPLKPKAQMTLNQSQNITLVGKSHRLSIPKVEVKVTLDNCLSEIDVSLIDRISTILNKQTIIRKTDEQFSPDLPPSHLDNQIFLNQIIDDSPKVETKFSIVIASPSLRIKLCFPIPDLRPLSDMDRMPWWKKNIRKETLHITFEDFHFEASLISPCTKFDAYEVRCSDMHLQFQQDDSIPPLSLARATVSKGTEKGFDQVRIACEIYPPQSLTGLEDEPITMTENLMSKSMMGFLEGINSNTANPFGKRKVASQQNEKVTELTIPAEKEEINRFIDNTSENVRYKIDVHLPNIQFLLPSKHFYEIIYNRLLSDLLLWVPSAPIHFKKSQVNVTDISEGLSDNFQNFSQFKFCNLYQNDNDCKEEPASDFSSVNDANINQNMNEENLNGQTLVTVSVFMGNIIGSIKTPYRNSEGKVVPDRNGEVMLSSKDCMIFAASGYKGDKDTCYICITAAEASLYHKANDAVSISPITLSRDFPLSTKKLYAVLYPSDSICKMEGNIGTEKNADALVISCKTTFDLLKNENIFIFAGGLHRTTLRHYMTIPSEHWAAQLADMFNVEDYPVDGYTLPDVLTELHFHCSNCSIDYRPLNLPMKSFITVDSLSISSNLTVLGDYSVMLIFIEDAGLFLSQDFSTKKVFLKDNYVCVANIGVLEICMKVPFENTENATQELTVSNNIIHIRTCSDSCKVLMEFIIYLASEGDLIKEADAKPITTDNINDRVILQPSESKEAFYSPTLGRSSEINEQSIVENMMKEAMLDTYPDRRPFDCNSPNNNSCSNRNGVEVFFFPDENIQSKPKEMVNSLVEVNCLPKVLHESFVPDTESALYEALQDYATDNYEEAEKGTDDEFCILDKIPGSGIRSPSGKPKYTSLMREYIPVNEHFFYLADGKDVGHTSDTVSHLPKPVAVYNLQDLSIVWHIYGGHDFPLGSVTNPTSPSSDKNGNHSNLQNKRISRKLNYSHTYPSAKTCSVSFTNGEAMILSDNINSNIMNQGSASPLLSRQNANAKWYTFGGPGRCRDILMELQLSKIKFKYDVYPDSSKLVSRHILTVNDMEIRDRLVTSDINKFLYQFSSESCPRQAKANMIHIKAITTRSEPLATSPETKLSVSVRPIRLNVDQDALIFLVQFFGSLLSVDKYSEYGEEETPAGPKPQLQTPVMTVNMAHLSRSDVHMNLHEKKEMHLEIEDTANSPAYFKSFVFSPAVPVRIDYHGKHIDINSQYGALAGLIIGLGQLNHSEITLKRIEFLNGVLGLNKLIVSVTNEWLNDIRKNQLPSILGGVGPMHSFVKLFGGLKDLVWLPIEQYHKDGRVLRGLQRGTSSFTASSAHAVLDLSGRFVSCIQSAAETMYDMVSPGPSVRSKSYKLKSRQPQDIREGVATAFGLVRHGLGDTATTIWKVAAEEHLHKGVSGAVGGVLRQIPPSVVQPIILASEATCTVIGGMTNQLVPDARKEAAEKWKS